MNVSKPVFLSAILLTVVGTAAAFPFVMDVYVANFPLDEQGNLKTSYVPTSRVQTLIKDANVSWSEGTGYLGKDLEAIDVNGYDEIVFYLSFKNWTAEAHYWLTVCFMVDGIRVWHYGGGDGDLLMPYASPHNNSASHHVVGTECLLTINVNPKSPQPAGWFLVDVSVYLRN